MKLVDNKATLSFSNGSPSVDLPVYAGSIGPDVRSWGGKLLAELRTNPKFRSVNSIEEDEGLATSIVVDRVRAGLRTAASLADRWSATMA